MIRVIAGTSPVIRVLIASKVLYSNVGRAYLLPVQFLCCSIMCNMSYLISSTCVFVLMGIVICQLAKELHVPPLQSHFRWDDALDY